MTGIILIIILAIGYALCGDTSGLEAIGKFVLYIALFLIVGWFIVEVPWLLILIVVIILIWAFVSSNNTSNSNTYNSQDKTYEDKSIVKPIENPTSFQSELQQNTKTPQQANDEYVAFEKQNLLEQVKRDYDAIKVQIMNKAKSGQYSNCENFKSITIDFYSEQLLEFMSRKLNQDIIKAGGIRHQSATYYISNSTMYNFYLSEINKLAKGDNIEITVIFKDNAKHIEYNNFPCTVSNTIVYPRDYSLYLRCSIMY